MPDERLEDLLQACTVEVTYFGSSMTAFFVAPRTLLTNIPASWADTISERQVRIRTQQGTVLTALDVTPIESVERHRAYGLTITSIVVGDFGEHLWVNLEMWPPIGGRQLIAGHSRIVNVQDDEKATRSGEFLGLSPDQFTADMVGAPVLNVRTGGVWGILSGMHGSNSQLRSVTVRPLTEVSSAVRRWVAPYSEATQTLRWAKALVPADKSTYAAEDTPTLLFRLYIPSERLYASETSQLLSLFRDWLITTHSGGIRQANYTTGRGETIEFYVEEQIANPPSLKEEFDKFSEFVTLCSTNREGAIRTLIRAQVKPAASSDLVDKFRRAIHQLELEMRYDRARRMLSLQQTLEQEMLELGIDLAALPSGQLAALLDTLVPGPRAAVPLALLSGQQPERQHVSVQITTQYIQHATNVITQNVAGTSNLPPQAKELLELIDRFGADDTAELQSAVYEFEDNDTPRDKRKAAKQRLKHFLRQLGDVVKGVTTELLAKYLESKGL